MKKILSVTGRILTWLLVVFAVCMMLFTIISVTTVDKQERSLFGYRMFVVLSDSMKDTFVAGDLVVSRETNPEDLKPGDIISFLSADENSAGEIVTHKIREVTVDEDGAPAFRTYGTTTGADDEALVPFNFVLGQYRFRIPGAGRFFEFIKTPAGYVAVILVPFLLIIALQCVNFVKLFRRYRAERRAETEAEREEHKKALEELERLRAELKKREDDGNPDSDTENR